MNITDLNVDCLEEIFERLNINDLLRVADTCSRFRKVTGLLFTGKNVNGSVVIASDDIQFGWLDNEYESEIKGILHSLRFLRCFGHLIVKMSIEFDDQYHYNEIFRYVNEYCSENLIKLLVDGSKEILIENISKPFANVKLISFSQCTLGRNLTNFNKWFPQMKYLKLEHNNVQDQKCIEMSFPHLKHFSYCNMWISSAQGFDDQNLKKFIRLNTQLRCLNLLEFNIKLLRYISKYLHQLNELDIPWQDWMYDYRKITPIQFKSVKKFGITLDSDHSIPLNSFAFDQLEGLEANGVTYNYLRDFMSKNSKITTLSVVDDSSNGSNISIKQILQITKALISLSSLTVHQRYGFSIDEIVCLMTELGQQLKHFTFNLKDAFEVNALEKRLGNKWHFVCENGLFVSYNRNIN